MSAQRIGIWLVGAKGGVATTTMTGLLALQQGLINTTGLITATEPFAKLQLAEWSSWVIGGHDIRPGRLYDEAYRMCAESRAIDPFLLQKLEKNFDEVEKNLRSGSIQKVGQTIAGFAEAPLHQLKETPRAAISRLQADIANFAKVHSLAHVVVVYVASTEPVQDLSSWPQTWSAMDKTLDDADKCPLTASCLYAAATFNLGYSFVNFTPSVGATPAALVELCQQKKARHCGFDGKTGETLLKSTLAPMFAKRNLEVMSWVGHNIFGNMDGKVLDDPINKKSKVTSKDRLLSEILGYPPQTLVTIEYIRSLGDWKTAWDHIHFRGFLGTPMTMQFTWQGCDSLLAAPLVVDLARLSERAWRAGEVGTLDWMAPFFKSPLGTTEHDFGLQFQMLEAWVEKTKTL
jgi:myo-inositol-1-phosphate synthase